MSQWGRRSGELERGDQVELISFSRNGYLIRWPSQFGDFTAVCARCWARSSNLRSLLEAGPGEWASPLSITCTRCRKVLRLMLDRRKEN